MFQADISNDNLSEIIEKLNQLQDNEWIDQNSRALFIEFTLYNVNLDLFAYCTILFEYLANGVVVTSFDFDPISLYTEQSVVIVAFDIIYMFLIVMFMLYQIKTLIKQKPKKYFRDGWIYIDWCLIIFSWVAFSMYLYRIFERSYLMNQLKNNKSQVINFQTINYWSQLLSIFLGFCCFLGSVKLLRILSFSRTMAMMQILFKDVFKELASFLFIYVVLYLAFMQLMYLMLYSVNSQFQSFAVTLMTGFAMLLGKFSADSFVNDSGALGYIVFTTYSLVMIIVLLNLFITILSDSFAKIRKEFLEEEKDSIFVAYFKILLERYSIRSKKEPRNPDLNLKDNAALLNTKTNNLVNFVNENYLDEDSKPDESKKY